MRPRKKGQPPRAAPPAGALADGRVLLVEDSEPDAELCGRLLSEAGLVLQVETVATRAEAERHVRTGLFDVVITDHGLPDGRADDIVRLVRDYDPELPCIVLTGALDDHGAAALLSQGAFDYIQKDRPARLPGAVQHALETRRARMAASDAVRSIAERQRDIAGQLVRTLENMSDGFVALDPTWCYTYINRRAAEMLGTRSEDLIGKYAWTTFPPLGRLPLQRACERVLVEQQPVAIEEPFLLSARWLESRIIPAPGGLAIFFRDVTGRREAVDGLQASERRLRSVVESAASGMIMADRAGKILLVNRTLEQQLGYTREELVGRPVELLIPHRFRESHPGHRAAFSETPAARPMGAGRDLFALHKDGHEVPVEIALTPLETEEGLTVLVTIVDITARKRGEVERDALSRQVLDLQEAERRALANELHDEVGQLLTGLKLMLEGHGTLGGPEEMGLLVREALACVRDVSMNLRPPMLDDLGLLPTLEWLVQRVRAHTGVAVRFTHAGLDRRIARGEETAAFRIVQEALTNVARHASVRHAELDVRVADQRLTISVSDRGAGFDPSMSASTGVTHGVRGMSERARLLGGRCTVESAPGGGTRVRAEFPVNRPAPEQLP
jgi:PAS domain S-box-containing protein